MIDLMTKRNVKGTRVDSVWLETMKRRLEKKKETQRYPRPADRFMTAPIPMSPAPESRSASIYGLLPSLVPYRVRLAVEDTLEEYPCP